jgi:hypothetical protein
MDEGRLRFQSEDSRVRNCKLPPREESRSVSEPNGAKLPHFLSTFAGRDQQVRTHLGLLGAEDYRYLQKSGCITIKGVDDAHEFRDTMQAMQTLQFPTETVDQMLRIIAAVLRCVASIVFTFSIVFLYLLFHSFNPLLNTILK